MSKRSLAKKILAVLGVMEPSEADLERLIERLRMNEWKRLHLMGAWILCSILNVILSRKDYEDRNDMEV